MVYMNTREAARKLNINPSRLSRAIWTGRVKPPMKGPGLAYLWTNSDIERAALVLFGPCHQLVSGRNIIS